MEFKVPLWKHQEEAFERAKDLNEFALFMDLGTGKTATTINLMRYKYMRHERLLKTLVLGPPAILENWRREISKYSNIDPKEVVILEGHGHTRAALVRDRGFSAGQPVGRIFITNYETLIIDAVFEELEKWGPELIVFDESHRCKNYKSMRTKQAIRISKLAKYRYILTGTPVLNTPMDLFSQFLILDQGQTFSKEFYVFQATYFYNKNASMKGMKNYWPDWRVKPNALEVINEKIKAKSVRVDKAKCLTLPPLIRKQVFVELGPEQKKYYAEMKADYVTFLGDLACTADLAITKALRLQQIVSGYIKLEDGQEVTLKANPRQTALKDLLEELTPNHKVLVWAVFKNNYAEIRRVCEELKIGFVEVTGETSSKERTRNVDSFNNDPKTRVLVGHPGSGGIGINLIAASYSIFYSRGFSLEYDLQAEARNYRGGSEIHSQIVRIDLVASETIDEVVLESLAKKEHLSEKILRDNFQEPTIRREHGAELV